MKAGKPVYVEKPLASSYEDCARINRISEQTGVPCFVAYYRRYLPYFQKVFDIVKSGTIGQVINVQVRYTEPLRTADAEAIKNGEDLPWRLHPEIAGGGYFYDMAPHQLDLLQHMFGVILEARGICSNRGGYYDAEDSVSACFRFENGLPGSGSWCYVAHESAREDCIDSTISPSACRQARAIRRSRCPIRRMCSIRSSRMSSSICRASVSAPVRVSRPRLSTGRWTVSSANSKFRKVK